MPTNPHTIDLLQSLISKYRTAADGLLALGLHTWPSQATDGDWHPGRLLFHDDRIAGVIDAESARSIPRVVDFASGVLQFSIIGGPRIEEWPEWWDATRFKAFANGYDAVQVLSRAEIAAVPLLMTKALISMVVHSVARTGRVGGFDGVRALSMVEKKAAWIMRKIN